MKTVKNQMLAAVQAHAEREARLLAEEFVRAASEDRDAILAALEFEMWLAASCAEVMERP